VFATIPNPFRAIALIVGLAASSVGCGGGDVQSPPKSDTDGKTFSVIEAVIAPPAGVVAIRGYVLVDGDSARLCTSLTLAVPPECAFDYLDVSGLRLDELASVATEGRVSWIPYEVELTGTLDGSRLLIE
jgi:hypothetical protein